MRQGQDIEKDHGDRQQPQDNTSGPSRSGDVVDARRGAPATGRRDRDVAIPGERVGMSCSTPRWRLLRDLGREDVHRLDGRRLGEELGGSRHQRRRDLAGEVRLSP